MTYKLLAVLSLVFLLSHYCACCSAGSKISCSLHLLSGSSRTQHPNKHANHAESVCFSMCVADTVLSDVFSQLQRCSLALAARLRESRMPIMLYLKMKCGALVWHFPPPPSVYSLWMVSARMLPSAVRRPLLMSTCTGQAKWFETMFVYSAYALPNGRTRQRLMKEQDRSGSWDAESSRT